MTYDTPLPPRPLNHAVSHTVGRTDDTRHRVVTAGALRDRGVSAATARDRCQPGGPWQMPLPGVFLLHAEPATQEERLRAVLLYAAGDTRASQVATARDSQVRAAERPVVSGLAALALRGFRSAPPLADIERIDVVVSRARRRRSTGWARILRTHHVPEAQMFDGLPVAPVARALADAVSQLEDPSVVHRLLAETVREGHCEVPAVVRELRRARLLGRPQVVDAVDMLLAEGRALAESRLYALVRDHAVPAPCWNVDVREPGGPALAALDAYWPERGLGVRIDTRTGERAGSGGLWPSSTRRHERLGQLGITVLSVRPEQLREAPGMLAQVLRTELVTTWVHEAPGYVLVEPR